jgi:hypothetical protein
VAQDADAVRDSLEEFEAAIRQADLDSTSSTSSTTESTTESTTSERPEGSGS